MNTHQRWAQKMMRNEGRPIRDIEKEAADLERRRIRMAIAHVIARLNSLATWDGCPDGPKNLAALAVETLTTATRAKKGKRK